MVETSKPQREPASHLHVCFIYFRSESLSFYHSLPVLTQDILIPSIVGRFLCQACPLHISVPLGFCLMAFDSNII